MKTVLPIIREKIIKAVRSKSSEPPPRSKSLFPINSISKSNSFSDSKIIPDKGFTNLIELGKEIDIPKSALNEQNKFFDKPLEKAVPHYLSKNIKKVI